LASTAGTKETADGPLEQTEGGRSQNPAAWSDSQSSSRAIESSLLPSGALQVDATPNDLQPSTTGDQTEADVPRSETAQAKPAPNNDTPGHNVRLPDGSLIPNPYPGPRNQTGFVTTPTD